MPGDDFDGRPGEGRGPEEEEDWDDEPWDDEPGDGSTERPGTSQMGQRWQDFEEVFDDDGLDGFDGFDGFDEDEEPSSGSTERMGNTNKMGVRYDDMMDPPGEEESDDEDWGDEPDDDEADLVANMGISGDDVMEPPKSYAGSVFDGMEYEDESEGDENDYEERPGIPAGGGSLEAEQLSMLYDDFQVEEGWGKRGADEEDLEATDFLPGERFTQALGERKSVRNTQRIEERTYTVAAEGVAVRAIPDVNGPRTGQILRQGETFTVVETVDGEKEDARIYLRLPDGKGWVFDDERVFPGFPSVKLTSVGGRDALSKDLGPEPVKKPLVAVIGRPNVGKSTLVNRICEVANVHGSITFDEPGVTRDRIYRSAQHTDRRGDSFMFELVDTGGLIFHDDAEIVSFRHEIKLQIDVALKEAVACIMVVDGRTGLTADDVQIARYLKKNYVSKGLKVHLAVAKCDRIATMDLKTPDFWELGLGPPLPISSLHGRGVWELTDAVIDGGFGGVFPLRPNVLRAEPPTLREQATSIAIIGMPNSGKSSLLNAFTGEDRAIVSDVAGTTADSIDAYLEVEDTGKLYRFVDTAGIKKRRRTKVGMQFLTTVRALKAAKRADVVLLCLDPSEVMSGNTALGASYWSPKQAHRYIARQLEERGCACVIVLTKWDAVGNKDERSQAKYVESIRSGLSGVGQWAEVVACSAKTGKGMQKVLAAVEKTLEAHRKRVPTPVLNEVVRDALMWRLPSAKRSIGGRQGRIYYAIQSSTEPPTIVLFCNNPRLFGVNYKVYLENKLRQDLAWFGTPLQLEWRKRSERRALNTVDDWLGPRMQPTSAEMFR